MAYLCLLTCVVQELLHCTCSTFETIGQAQRLVKRQDVYLPGPVGRCSKDLSRLLIMTRQGSQQGSKLKPLCYVIVDPSWTLLWLKMIRLASLVCSLYVYRYCLWLTSANHRRTMVACGCFSYLPLWSMEDMFVVSNIKDIHVLRTSLCTPVFLILFYTMLPYTMLCYAEFEACLSLFKIQLRSRKMIQCCFFLLSCNRCIPYTTESAEVYQQEKKRLVSS